MKHITTLIFLILFLSCKNTNKKNIESRRFTENDSLDRSYNIGTINKVSGKILGIDYNAFCTYDDYIGCITNSKKDTLFKDETLNPNPEFIDFDKDGLIDITFKANIADEYDLIKFDTLVKGFRKVEGFNKYARPKKIENSKYWYSYHTVGCADQCWESDLFYIDKFKTIRIGNISQNVMDGNGNINLTINNVNKDTLIPFQHLNEKSVAEWEKNKFESIERYWKENHTKFAKASR